ncbi:hypothetical protein RB614_04880 [Phytohabitans sp. ZYX-F-186]|uniref:Glycosyltransferase 2-like domain-containing protein n=1 Tax=Phytohabitans maris TaxID=3071409 RepID=A0ABU0Z9Y8_9ACTN|nr:hypothetical protein [Phytohabitans sp. ZYX-F-186]MDQ7903853.1 hypothetical protein [Phytohabitans sp. ZYX-F-186]
MGDDHARAREIRHHGDHDGLLAPPPSRSGDHAPLDAIVVPTARPIAFLDEAIRLAGALDCPLVALCSGRVGAAEAMRRAPEGVRMLAVDCVRPGLPSFETSATLAGYGFERHTDAGLKRNTALALARMLGWRRVVFLDDDMAVRRPADLPLAAGLLGPVTAVGLRNDGFPDNSVVCHAFRAVGGRQGTFIGSGALAVAVDRVTSFFPSVYNEDWFFLLEDGGIGQVAAAGTVTQRVFDPYEDPERARSEEFGDCLAEGIFALLDDGRRVSDADEEYWEQFLAARHSLIAGVLRRVPDQPAIGGATRARMARAIRAAQERLTEITPDMCVRYLKSWQRDRDHWVDFLATLPAESVAGALRRLGLRAETTHLRRAS